MNSLRIRLQLRSPLGTPLVGDTLFGHLFWGLAYHEGDSAVRAFIEATSGPEPPLVISDPLPAGHWPSPALPAPSPEAFDKLLEESGGPDVVEAHQRVREVMRRQWLPHELWLDLAPRLDAAGIARLLIERRVPDPDTTRAAAVAHNTINRLSGRSLEEGGFFFDEQFFPDRAVRYDVWALARLEPDRVRRLFEWGLEGGYGRDSGTGKGHLVVTTVEPADLPTVNAPNAVMTLGTCAPAESDPADGVWNLDVRHGKLGGPWATPESEEQSTVFKYPIILLARGAVLRTDRPAPVVGRVVHDVHPTRPEVVTCARTLTLPVHLTEEAIPCQPTA